MREESMSVSLAEDVAYVRFGAPDLEVMRAFLTDFGLSVAQSDSERLFMRGLGAAPFVHATERSEPGFRAVGVRLASLAELERLAKHEQAAVTPLDAPGGGFVVRLTEPNGFTVEAVAGQSEAQPQSIADETPWNDARSHERLRAVKRIAKGAANVVRLGHCVLNVSNFRDAEAWWKDRFGLITSDEVQARPDLAIGAFLRCDRGETPTDHHTLFLLQSPRGPGFNHAAFEVADLDDLMRGHNHLGAAGAKPAWGVGRHVLGSQVFDYWRDPYGHTLEHWTDGDLLTAADGSNVVGVPELLGVQWGPAMPADF
jgi:catechol 2,3-dioxygenase-like lactoylglutathione lyase family enzyme